jgi:hypothetical protein
MFLNPDAALGFSGASVIQALTDREWARLANTGRAAGLPDRRSAGRVVAPASVPGSLDASALRRLAEPTLEIGLPPPDRVVDAVNTVPWWHKGRVPAPQPDIMAAALLLKILSERSDKAAEWLWAVIEGAVSAPLIDRLARLTFDAMIVSGSALGLTRYLRKIIADDPSRASKLEFLSYENNLPFGLASLAADITRALLAAISDQATRASHLNHLRSPERCRRRCRCLGGDPRGGRNPTSMAQDNPARFAPDLALSLARALDRLKEAGFWVCCLEEAVPTGAHGARPWRAGRDRAGLRGGRSPLLGARVLRLSCAAADATRASNPQPVICRRHCAL